MKVPPADAARPPFRRAWAHPLAHGLALAALAALMLAFSWRRWPDAFVDFGRELYLPWRLAEGAVLYRDVDDFYGPLSQYFNAALFRGFGPGLMVLVWANLVIFAGIVILAYRLLRQAWGAGAALAGAAVLIAVFGFSRLIFTGNCNYATPYAHEATHGVLVLIALATVLAAWLRGAARWHLPLAGLLGGLALVLKPEIALAAAALAGAAAILRGRSGGAPAPGGVALAAALGALPTVGFALFFWRHLGWGDAWAAAARGWLNVVGAGGFVSDPVQLKHLGLDAPGRHAAAHLGATLVAAAGLGAIAGLTALFERATARWARPLAVALAAGGAAVLWVCIDSLLTLAGRCFLGLLLGYLGVCAWRLRRRDPRAAGTAFAPRMLLAVLGAALMARMALAGRIEQFGFYQAAFAGVALTAILVGEFPAVVARTRGGRGFAALCVLVAIGMGAGRIVRHSRWTHARATHEMGAGRDRFLVYPASEPVASMAALLQGAPRGSTLLVLPEGLMLNYLARLPSPLPPFFYYSVVTAGGREAQIVTALEARPPDFIVTLPRDLRDYGIAHYGERPEPGGEILAWMRGRYTLHGYARGSYAGPGPAPGTVAYSQDYPQIFRRLRPEELPAQRGAP
jgi:hypothetical protein